MCVHMCTHRSALLSSPISLRDMVGNLERSGCDFSERQPSSFGVSKGAAGMIRFSLPSQTLYWPAQNNTAGSFYPSSRNSPHILGFLSPQSTVKRASVKASIPPFPSPGLLLRSRSPAINISSVRNTPLYYAGLINL